MPAGPKIPSGGSRQQKAAQLRAEAEAGNASTPAQPAGATGAGGAQFHHVQSGETLSGIASQYGKAPEAIWDHPLNKQIRERRGSPGAIAQGDGLYIPAAQPESPETPTVGQGDYVVKAGDCMSSIARDTGHLWGTIWNDAANSELKSVRKDPNVLFPGDLVTIPEVQPKQEAGETEMRHRFVRKGEPAYLPLQVLYNDKPMANEPYELRVGDLTYNGTTDPQGKIEVRIPGNARRATLIVGTEPRQQRYELDLGAVDPIESMSGVQQRLRNLGYQRVPVNGVCEAQTEQALQAYQKANDLPPTGYADSPTREKLKYKHGS